MGMGKSLYDQSPTARAVFDEADRVLGWPLTKVCFEGPDADLTQTKVCQPALFVHGSALLAAPRLESLSGNCSASIRPLRVKTTAWETALRSSRALPGQS